MNQSSLIIQKADISDIDVIQRIGRQTFSETFSEQNSAENMDSYLKTNFSTEQIIKELTNKDSEFYLAYVNKELAGYLKINFGPAQTEMRGDPQSLEIERIYVLRAFQGQKIGQALFEKALQMAELRQLDYIWLGVWEKNGKAIRFYEKNGFTPFDKHIFKLGSNLQTDILMRLDLKNPMTNSHKDYPAL